MKLWDIAHSRTGDKGNISNISLIAYDPKDYALLKERVTAERVKEHSRAWSRVRWSAMSCPISMR